MNRRFEPTDCRHEPAYPDHETVLFCLRAPDLCLHLPSMRCPIPEPHEIAKCGEFDPIAA